MEQQKFKTLNELIATYQQGKKFFKSSKKQFKLNYEEIYILNYLYNCNSNEITAKEIALSSDLKPYYLTKALQKLIKMEFLSKKRSQIDERTVVVYIDDQQRAKITQIIEQLQSQL
ncbi:MarR family transcriptional regulator [Staphylococcus gallinarum]|jgi:MarR family transcriptional regulator|uniref:Accessory regulator R n=5 Tax=Staphylococcus gallinarum TaxID=1293 RepID=A0A0D0SQH8_STAGA|nr:MarR family transcriptional regulator [Staphylococcus gallinarum]KIR11464.1 spermidine/putrescine ABC transporter ATP-binding protein [Staphylococcus gallinarum]MBU7217047.1 MarR family transcriptional regulator [Staphylococcus gallinarum]MCD8784986.1 MarR family transcriptional regulator [Staphylococcus gallinarum]MCD8792736.1 MarR family transcriptional regulator [Staphylococcus gallinarum]MCD8821526.1 MarR family transcriptional regulator [Staphylococcus gallinarum]